MEMVLMNSGGKEKTVRVGKPYAEDDEQKLQSICQQLLQLADADETVYETILMQGTANIAIESVFTSTVSATDHILILTNGLQGKQMVQMAKRIGISFEEISFHVDQVPSAQYVEEILQKYLHITHIAMVHCETATGILNPLQSIAQLAKKYNKTLIVDAVNSYGCMPLQMGQNEIDYLVSVSNRCLHGEVEMPFVIANKTKLATCQKIARSVALDLHAQAAKLKENIPLEMIRNWEEVLEDIVVEDAIERRYANYLLFNEYVQKEMKRIGFQVYLEANNQSPMMTTFYYPTKTFSFDDFRLAMKRKGWTVYPGQIKGIRTFRFENIGVASLDEIKDFIRYVEAYMEELMKVDLYFDELVSIDSE